MKPLINIFIIWFLVIQSLGIDGRAIYAIPMQDKKYCEAAMAAVNYGGMVRTKYNCVDAGSVYF